MYFFALNSSTMKQRKFALQKIASLEYIKAQRLNLSPLPLHALDCSVQSIRAFMDDILFRLCTYGYIIMVCYKYRLLQKYCHLL